MTRRPAAGTSPDAGSAPGSAPPEHGTARVTITVDGAPVTGAAGQTIAGVLVGAGMSWWRTTSAGGRPRGVFCGIGVCFDCVVEVNGLPDVRACLRRAHEGDAVVRQHIALPVDPA